MIIVIAALKGGVGKTTTSVYLSALASAARRPTTLIDADPQASAAEWFEASEDDSLESVTLVEAPTDRMLLKALDRVEGDEVAVVDTPPGNERLLAKAIEKADTVVIPTRIGGVETGRVEAVLDLVPTRTPVGLVICSARTYARLPGRGRRVGGSERSGVGEHPGAGRDRLRTRGLAGAGRARRLPQCVAARAAQRPRLTATTLSRRRRPAAWPCRRRSTASSRAARRRPSRSGASPPSRASS